MTLGTGNGKSQRAAAFERILGSIRRTLLGLLVGLALVLLIAFLAAGSIYDYADTASLARLPAVDAVVGLAGGRGRINAAARVWRQYRDRDPGGLPPILYISGMGPQANWSVLAQQVQPNALEALTPDRVILETESGSTEENARWLARYAIERGWRRVLLVTSSYHMRRSRLIFEKVFVSLHQPMEFETLSVTQEPFRAGSWRGHLNGIEVTLTEYFKWLYYQALWKPPVSSRD